MTTKKKQTPFKAWLNSQPRTALTYAKFIPRQGAEGWTEEDFALEARQRGVPLSIWTVCALARKKDPQPMNGPRLREKFPGVPF